LFILWRNCVENIQLRFFIFLCLISSFCMNLYFLYSYWLINGSNQFVIANPAYGGGKQSHNTRCQLVLRRCVLLGKEALCLMITLEY